jgi:acetyl esterase/lipase
MFFMHMSAKLILTTCLVAFGAVAITYWWWNLPYRRFPLSIPRAATDSLGSPLLAPTFPDLPYASKSGFEKLDLYLPKNRTGKIPVVIWIHGGGCTVGDKRSMPRKDFGPAPKPRGPYGPYQVQVPDVGALLSKGFAVVSLNYHLGISVLTASKSAVRDVKAAVRFLHEKADVYGLDESRFVVWGNSMGGYMAAMIGVTGDQSTIFDDRSLADVNARSDISAVIVWFGAEDRMPGKSLSLAYYVRTAKSLPAFLIVNGDKDPVISVAQATRLYDALIAAGAKARLTIVPGAGHEDPLFTETQMGPALAFIDDALKGKL